MITAVRSSSNRGSVFPPSRVPQSTGMREGKVLLFPIRSLRQKKLKANCRFYIFLHLVRSLNDVNSVNNKARTFTYDLSPSF